MDFACVRRATSTSLQANQLSTQLRSGVLEALVEST
jgi:hypothetical protein